MAVSEVSKPPQRKAPRLSRPAKPRPHAGAWRRVNAERTRTRVNALNAGLIHNVTLPLQFQPNAQRPGA
jgi:hypothetical protein